MTPPNSSYQTDRDKIVEKWQQKIRRGLLRMIILRMFSRASREKRPLSGSDIKESIETQMKGKWSPSPGSLYPVLSEMEEDKIIEEVPSSNKKNRYFVMTEFGQDLYNSLMEKLLVTGRAERAKFYASEEFKDDLVQYYRKLSVSELKVEFERQKKVVEVLEDLLREKIISDPEL